MSRTGEDRDIHSHTCVGIFRVYDPRGRPVELRMLERSI
jgi:hypothetical protein